MAITVLFFGQLIEITGQRQMSVAGVKGTAELKEKLLALYPRLAEIVMNVAVDTLIIREDVALKPGSTVAFLPPFSGG